MQLIGTAVGNLNAMGSSWCLGGVVVYRCSQDVISKHWCLKRTTRDNCVTKGTGSSRGWVIA